MCQCASSEGVSVLVDAEQTYFQAAIHHLTMHHLVPRFNGQKAVIYNTIQTYLTVSAWLLSSKPMQIVKTIYLSYLHV